MFFPTLRRLEIIPRSTYYDKHYRMTSAMIRARQQYLVKNIIGGVILTTFVLSVYAYTIHAVAQDDFSDIAMPEAPAPAPTPSPEVLKAVARGEDPLGVRKGASVARMKQ